MTPESRLQLALLAIGLAWLFCAWIQGFRVLAKDRFRGELFALRDRLFDLAASGGIAFSDHRYLRQRGLINVFLRDTDRISFPWLILLTLAMNLEREEGVTHQSDAWREELAALPASTARHMVEIDDQLFRLVLQRIWTDSIVVKLLRPLASARRLADRVPSALRAVAERRIREPADASCPALAF